MKKIFFSALCASLMLTSCQSEQVEPNTPGSKQEVSFVVSLPDVAGTRAGSVNSRLGGVSNNMGENVTFNLALYLEDELVYAHNQTVSSTGNHTSAEFRPVLVIGEEYRLVAYAEFDNDVVATGENTNSVASNINNIELNSGINNEKNDEYYVSTMVEAAPKISAELKRPYGKLRLLADDLEEVERQYGAKIESIEIAYKYTRPKYFDATDGNLLSPYTYETTPEYFSAPYTKYTDGTFANLDGTQELEGEDYHTIFVDYIPATLDGNDQMMPFTIKVTFDSGKVYTRDFPIDIPIRRNYITTLKGNLFTMDSEITLVIEDEFNDELFQVIPTVQ